MVSTSPSFKADGPSCQVAATCTPPACGWPSTARLSNANTNRQEAVAPVPSWPSRAGRRRGGPSIRPVARTAWAVRPAARGDDLVGVYLALIAALTVPHALVVTVLDVREGLWRMA